MNSLLLDAGNTRLKWALCTQGEFVERGYFAYDDAGLPDQFAEQWDALLQTKVRTNKPGRLLLSNVAGEHLAAALQSWLDAWRNAGSGLQEAGRLTIETVQAQSQAFGVRCAYQLPAQLGADRWAALVAARHHLRGASCIIDCGTAQTIDVLSAEGLHVGGLIAPGMTMMRQSLASDTAQIDVGDAAGDSIFAVRNTAGAVQAGIMAASIGAVQHVLQQCRDAWGDTPTCVVTGGNAEMLLPALPAGTRHDPDWVLKGLAIIADCQQ